MYSHLSNLVKTDAYIALRVVIILIGTLITLTVLRKVYQYYYLYKEKRVLLELTPPSRGDHTSEATNQLFLSLYGLGYTKSLIDRILGRKKVFSLEIVATRSEGIRYVIVCSQEISSTVEHMVSSYTPDVKVRKIKDYIGDGIHKSRVLEFKQKQHFAYPLKNHDFLESHDPISYITNAMTKLGSDELMCIQLIIKPIHSRKAEELRNRIMTNDNLMLKMGGAKIPVLPVLSRAINVLLFGVADIFTNAYHGQSEGAFRSQSKDLEYKKQVAKGIKPVRTLSYFEHELVESISAKLQQPLFQTDIRLLIQVDGKKEFGTRRKNIESALSLYTVPKYQQLSVRLHKYHFTKMYSLYALKHRLPAAFATHSSVFSSMELASLYHFPHTQTAKTENVVKSLSKTLPAPISLKGGHKLDILLGENIHQGVSTSLGLTEAERERHIYVIGGTGNGKTTMLLYGIVQDIKNGKGVAILDPHGDLAERILRHIPEERINDVIYMNPDDLAYPIGMNLLELPAGLTGDDLLREKDLVTESAISVLRKIFSEDDSGGHRIEYVLRNSIQTALTLEEPTLFTIFQLLNDAKFRRSVVKNLEDKNLSDFWKNELGKAGEFQRVKMAAGITAKIGRFLFSASARLVLEQPKSTIDFDDILASRKILICNFSKGLLGEDTSTLFGTTVLAKIQTAALRRARLSANNRTPYYLYVDEFQNFATMSFVQMLSEARKYKLFLTMAEQSTSQQDQQRLVDIILANVGTVVCFRSGSPADERLVLPLFSPYVEQGEIANLPSYNFYTRIAAVHSQEPMSGVTVLLEDNGSEQLAKQAIESSRRLYAKKREVVESVIKKVDEPTRTVLSKKNQASKKVDEFATAKSLA